MHHLDFPAAIRELEGYLEDWPEDYEQAAIHLIII
jgi:hypothetical protein